MNTLQDIFRICCGLNVHKETVAACLLKGGTDIKPEATITTFLTLMELKSRLEAENSRHIATEVRVFTGNPVEALFLHKIS